MTVPPPGAPLEGLGPPKVRPRAAPERPGAIQEAPRGAQERLKTGQEWAKIAQEQPKSGQERLKSDQGRAKSVVKGILKASWLFWDPLGGHNHCISISVSIIKNSIFIKSGVPR